MNTSAEIILPWGDETHVLFALKGKQIEHLETACGAHISVIVRAVMQQEPSYRMLRSVISLGMEGGGRSPTDTAKNMERFFDGRPLADPTDEASPLTTAIKIIGACWFGIPTIRKSNIPDDGLNKAGERFGIPAFRAKFMEFGVDPTVVDRMSLYEILSMMREFEKDKPEAMTDEHFQAMKKRMETLGIMDKPSE